MNDRSGKHFPVSWDQFHRDSRALAWRLAASGPYAAVVGITRGGLVPAAIVARELDIRVVETISVASYDHQTQAAPRILKGISEHVLQMGETGRLLVVDDLVDTGATMRIVREMLPHAHVATVYAKPQGRPLVDSFITEVSQDTWIYFPWDLELSYAKPISST